MSFVPRLDSNGMSGSPYYYSSNPYYTSGWGLPNCTCYAWGRFWEEAPDQGAPVLSRGNAEDWWNHPDGYERGSTPKIGAVLCLKDGPHSGDGHVAIVEAINSDGSIVTSNSAYAGAYFYLETRRAPYWNSEGYIFQGFIYNSAVGGAPPEPDYWISGNRYLSRSEMDNNAIKFYYTMSRLGASYNAILGMLANIEAESTINPGIWESLAPYAGGYGLVQWTPYTKYSEWAGSGWQDNGQAECERIKYEASNGLQWFGNDYAPDFGYPASPPISLWNYFSSSLDPKTLADYWILYYEHPAYENIGGRIAGHQSAVEYYAALLGGVIPPVPVTKKFAILKRFIDRKRGLI